MKYILVICSAILAFDSFAEEKVTTTVEPEYIETYFEDLWETAGTKLKTALKNKRQIPDVREAFGIIWKYVFNLSSDQIVDYHEILSKLQEVFPDSDLMELLILIDDAVELKNKYPLILDFVIRSKYAKKAVQAGVSREEARQLASSEYIYLPPFVLRENFKSSQLNEVLSDIGCGILWKDRAKYLFAFRKYSEEEKVIKFKGLDKFPGRIRNYLMLLEEIDHYFSGSCKHWAYRIAQDFYYSDVKEEKILQIFSFSKKEWKSFIKPKTYQ